jgi:hypothetical protein
MCRQISKRLDLLVRLDLVSRLQEDQLLERVKPNLTRIADVLVSITRILEDIGPRSKRRFLGVVLAWKYSSPLHHVAIQLDSIYEDLSLILSTGTNDAIHFMWQEMRGKLDAIAKSMENDQLECK